MGELRLLNVKQVSEKVGLAVSTIWRDKRNGNFPAPRKFGASTLWSSEHIDQWIHEKFSDAA